MSEQKRVKSYFSEQLSQFPFAEMCFPTDSVTVKDLRSLKPRDFEFEPEAFKNVIVKRSVFLDLLDNALYFERLYAARHFLDQQCPRLASRIINEDTAQIFESLHSSYTALGLSSSRSESQSAAEGILRQVREVVGRQKRTR